MGRRGASETPIAILAAFIEKRSWRQTDLARRVGVSVRSLRECLLAMESSGTFPLERQDEPPHVVWTLPASWLPEGVVLTKRDAREAVRLLARLEVSAPRDHLIQTLLGPTALLHARADVVDRAPTVLARIEDGRNARSPVRIRYTSTTSGSQPVGAWRTLSVQAVLYGDHPRFVALEHGRRGLRTFRVDRVHEVCVAEAGIFRPCEEEVVARYLAAGVDGYHGDAPVQRCSFVVREPEARWVGGNLPVRNATVERTPEGLRVEVATSAVTVLARFVVGLGIAARVLDEPLLAEVRRIASEALTSASKGRGPGPVRTSGPAPTRKIQVSTE